MNKREQKLEVLRIVEDGMIWLTAGDTDRIPKPLRDLLYAFCKGFALLLEENLKGR